MFGSKDCNGQATLCVGAPEPDYSPHEEPARALLSNVCCLGVCQVSLMTCPSLARLGTGLSERSELAVGERSELAGKDLFFDLK